MTRKCEACGATTLLRYNRSRKRYRCLSLLHCDERVEKAKAERSCPHPPARYYAWVAADQTLCVGCCDCGAVLRGAAQPLALPA